MNALLVAMVLSQTAVADQPAPVSAGGPGFRLHVGAQVGLPTRRRRSGDGWRRRRCPSRRHRGGWWEPSGFLQSYSVGAAWRPLDRFFFIGARVRLMQFQPPWTKGFNGANDNHLGLGLETGVRLRVGPSDKGVICIALGGTYLPTQSVNLQWLLGLTAGFSWGVWER